MNHQKDVGRTIESIMSTPQKAMTAPRALHGLFTNEVPPLF